MISFDQFRKSAKVEYLKFSTPEKKEGGEDSSSEAKFSAAEYCFNLGKYKEALQIYDELARTCAGRLEGLNALGGAVRCHAALGEREKVGQRLADIRAALAHQGAAVRRQWEEWVTLVSQPLTAP
jgi:hypothetical protein